MRQWGRNALGESKMVKHTYCTAKLGPTTIDSFSLRDIKECNMRLGKQNSLILPTRKVFGRVQVAAPRACGHTEMII